MKLNRRRFLKSFLLSGLGLALNVKRDIFNDTKIEKNLGGYLVPQKFADQLKARKVFVGKLAKLEYKTKNGEWVNVTGRIVDTGNTISGLSTCWVDSDDMDFITGRDVGNPLGHVMPREEDI